MRRTVLPALLVGTVAIAGCSNFRDMFSAHANTAAEAAGLELSPKQLSEIRPFRPGWPTRCGPSWRSSGAPTGTIP